MLSFHYLSANTGTDLAPTPEQLVRRVLAILREYHRDCGDYIPMLGVVAPRKETGFPHIHLVLQRHDRSETEPLVDVALLKRLGRKHWLKVTLSVHPKPRDRDSESETDLREYVANHLKRSGAEFLPGRGVRTNFSKERRSLVRPRRAAVLECHERRAAEEHQRDLDDRAWLAQNDRPRSTGGRALLPCGVVTALPTASLAEIGLHALRAIVDLARMGRECPLAARHSFAPCREPDTGGLVH